MKWLREVIVAVAIGLIVFLISLPFATVGVDAHHDGVMLKPASDVARGAVLHRETFTQYGPATTLVQAGLLKVFGFELRVLRYAAVGCYGLTVVFLCLFWRYFLPWNLVLVSVCWLACAAYYFRPYWVLEPWSSGMALCAQSLALLLLSIACRCSSNPAKYGLLFFAGAVVSLVFWFRQPVGAMMSVAAVSVPVSIRLQEQRELTERVRLINLLFRNVFLWAYVLGGILVALGFLFWLWRNTALDAWYLQNVVWPRKFAQGLLSAGAVYRCFGTSQVIVPLLALLTGVICCKLIGQPSPNWRACMIAVMCFAWWGACFAMPGLLMVPVFDKLIPIGSMILMIRWLVHSPLNYRGLLLPVSLGISAMSSWAQFFPVPCLRHLFWGVCPIVGVFIYLVWRQSTLGAVPVSVILCAFVLPLGVDRFVEARTHLAIAASPHTVAGPMYGMRPYRDECRQPQKSGYEADFRGFEAAREAIGAGGNKLPVILYGVDAMWCLISECRENASAVYVSWSDLQEFGIFDERERAIRGKREFLVVVQENFVPGGKMEILEENDFYQLWRGEAFGGAVRIYLRASGMRNSQ